VRTPRPGGPAEDMETLIPHKEKICHLFRRKKYALLDFKGHRDVIRALRVLAGTGGSRESQ
ncbi:MAG: hypothetical protein KF851_00005, partial [Pirellulaceae bacterium]|nr:hypothetical protein [Pirellulaceae bacterium]